MIGSPTDPTELAADLIEVRVPVAVIGVSDNIRFDGVTDVYDLASVDLSLPGVECDAQRSTTADVGFYPSGP